MIDLLAPFRAGAKSGKTPQAPATGSSDAGGRIVAVANEKGGCGKSTMAMHLAVSLLKRGLRVTSMDIDVRQATLTRYIENRQRYIDAAGHQIAMPDHYNGDGITGSNDDSGATAGERLHYLIDGARANYDIAVIDTPGADTPLGRIAHSEADLILTPVNDSFIDLDVLAQIDARRKAVIGPSPFATLILANRTQRREQGRPAAPWLVARNRLGTLESHNTRDVDWALDLLKTSIGVSVVPGFSERVIFRELFLVGLTILDLKDAAGGQPLSRSHIAARNEVAALTDAVLDGLGMTVRQVAE